MISFVVSFIFVTTSFSSIVLTENEKNWSNRLGHRNLKCHWNIITNESDIKIFFYSQEHVDEAMEIHHSDYINSVGKTDFDYKRPTVFTVHGWHNQVESPFCQEIKNSYLKVRNVNVFVIDWNSIARHMYYSAYTAVPKVGNVLGKLIQSMVAHNKLDLSTTTIVGHSLGAHVAGLAGAALGGQVNTIIGLDAAWPFFSINKIEDRLDRTDAKFVQSVHTCAGGLGFPVPIGHVDYFANDGRWQPGCHFDLLGICAHSMAYRYFSESLVAEDFIAKKCDNWGNFNKGMCSFQPISHMGQYTIDKSANGTYYFETNKKSPYGKGNKNNK